MNIRLAAVVAVVLSAGTACASNAPPTASAYSGPQTTMPADTPLPGAVTNDSNAVRNSDNRPLSARTGLNSDPNDPNGTGTPVSSSHYDYNNRM
jgi:hypothetical protein